MLNSSKTCETFAKRWKVDKQNMYGLVASYNISLLILKTVKPHINGEKLIFPAIQEVVTTVMHINGGSVIEDIDPRGARGAVALPPICLSSSAYL